MIKKINFQSILIRYLFLAIAFGLVAFSHIQISDQSYEFYIFDVGQGDAALFITPDQQRVLIDGGPAGRLLPELSSVLPYFDTEIDLMILTHPHADHVDGLIEVIERIPVHKVLTTSTVYDTEDYREFLQIIENKKIPLYLADDDRDWQIGKTATLDILYPMNQTITRIKNINNASIVAKLEFCPDIDKCQSILLPGDAEAKVWNKLIKNKINLDSDILKVAHHGSKNGTTSEMIEAISPEIAVISSGKDNIYHHPHQQALDLYKKNQIPIYRTDQNGTFSKRWEIN